MSRGNYRFDGLRTGMRAVIAVAAASLLGLLSLEPASAKHIPGAPLEHVADFADPSIQHQLQHVLDHAVSHSQPSPGAALLAISKLNSDESGVADASVLVAGAHSLTDDTPIRPHTPFGIASISKSMVAALTLIYSERGLLRLETPLLELVDNDGWILDHVSNPAFRRNLETATVRDLLAHRSGLADYWANEAFLSAWLTAKHKKWSPTEVLGWAGRQDPVCAPNACFHYADTNYVIIGLALEGLTGRKLHQLLRAEIFNPLEMHCTWMFFEEPIPEGCVEPTHSYEGDLDVTDNRMQSADWSGGGVYSTLEDQLKLLRGLFHGELLSPESLAVMQSWGKSDLGEEIVYGLGLYKTGAGPDMTLIGHTGIHNSFAFLWVETGVLITGSLNQSHNAALEELVYPVVRVLRDGGGYVDHSH